MQPVPINPNSNIVVLRIPSTLEAERMDLGKYENAILMKNEMMNSHY
jgi:hypothetical protein